jgi:uncharacterized protein YidB (DUF937 family)
MGLLDALAKEFLPKLAGGSGGGKSPLVDIVMGLLTNPKTGGLQGLVENFKGRGMENIINSWIGTGQNMPISPEQLLQALGKDRLQGIAAKTGLSQNEISGGLASLLPEIIDKLTPQGKLPDSGLLEQELQEMKKKIVGF